jgi:hypothetical protein
MSRSSKNPENKKDATLSLAHLKDSVAYHKKHIKDHQNLLKKGGSEEYNKDHIKHHAKNIKKDQKLIGKRQKDLAKGKLKRAMRKMAHV